MEGKVLFTGIGSLFMYHWSVYYTLVAFLCAQIDFSSLFSRFWFRFPSGVRGMECEFQHPLFNLKCFFALLTQLNGRIILIIYILEQFTRKHNSNGRKWVRPMSLVESVKNMEITKQYVELFVRVWIGLHVNAFQFWMKLLAINLERKSLRSIFLIIKIFFNLFESAFQKIYLNW